MNTNRHGWGAVIPSLSRDLGRAGLGRDVSTALDMTGGGGTAAGVNAPGYRGGSDCSRARWARPAFALALALACSAACAQDRVEVVIDSLTNDTAVVVDWQPQYPYEVSSGPGGMVSGTASGWLDADVAISNRAIPNNHYHFVGWSGVPTGKENENPVIFSLDKAYTNVVASFGLNSAAILSASFEQGIPTITVSNYPSTITVVVQRSAASLTNADWQNITNLPPGTIHWTDNEPPEAWRHLFYRLAE